MVRSRLARRQGGATLGGMVWKRLRPRTWRPSGRISPPCRGRRAALRPARGEGVVVVARGRPGPAFRGAAGGGRVALSKRSWRGPREVARHQYPWGDLKAVKVRRGPLLESMRLTFADGYSLRVGALPRRQSRPLERYLAGEAEALDRPALARAAHQLLPGDGRRGPAARRVPGGLSRRAQPATRDDRGHCPRSAWRATPRR